MFGFGKDKNTDKRSKKPKELQASCDRGVQHKSGDQSARSEKIRAQALANAAAAREQIGADVLDKIAAAMTKKQQSSMQQAKNSLKGADVDRMLDELKFLLDEGRP